jgi:hypothetical protein
MAQEESQSERIEKLPFPNLVHPEVAAWGKKRVDEFVKVQKVLLEKLQEMNHQWFGRLQSEVNVASEFAFKLRTVRSIPDAAVVCQEWMNRRFDVMTEDGERLFADIQKFMEASSCLMANGSRSGGPDPGSTLST